MNHLQEVLQKFPANRVDQLIPILQGVQDHDGYLSGEALLEVSKYSGVPVNRVYGVATFYNQFRFTKPGEYNVVVCRGTACHVRGSAGVLDLLSQELGIKAGETTEDGLFGLEVVACLGSCGLAPVVTVNGEVYAAVNQKKLQTILGHYRGLEKKAAPAAKEANANA